MGMFDSLWVRCHCGKEIEFQTKAGECYLRSLNIDELSPAIVVDLDGQSAACECGKVAKLEAFVPFPTLQLRIIIQ